jgi:hypothetical protein
MVIGNGWVKLGTIIIARAAMLFYLYSVGFPDVYMPYSDVGMRNICLIIL